VVKGVGSLFPLFLLTPVCDVPYFSIRGRGRSKMEVEKGAGRFFLSDKMASNKMEALQKWIDLLFHSDRLSNKNGQLYLNNQDQLSPRSSVIHLKALMSL
jgi:hypothetical protein